MMKKKFFAFLLVIILCFSVALPATAADSDGFAEEYYRVMDMADLLTDREETALIQTLDEISLRQNMDIVVATTANLEGFSVREYADQLYEQCHFGYGNSKDGLLLLISMEDRDWYITTCGYGITAFTDAGIDYIGEQITPDLSDGNYADAFANYASLCDEFITRAKSWNPYNKGNLPQESLSKIWIPVALIIGFVLAEIIVGFMKSQLRTVRPQAAANDYVRKGSLNITESHDRFLYHTVTRTEKPKNNGSSGSSTHRSSSGTTHGGKGGKF